MSWYGSGLGFLERVPLNGFYVVGFYMSGFGFRVPVNGSAKAPFKIL